MDTDTALYREKAQACVQSASGYEGEVASTTGRAILRSHHTQLAWTEQRCAGIHSKVSFGCVALPNSENGEAI
jgi:hypothetical protein